MVLQMGTYSVDITLRGWRYCTWYGTEILYIQTVPAPCTEYIQYI